MSQGEAREQARETLKDPCEDFGIAAEWGGGTWWPLSREAMWSDFSLKHHPSQGRESTLGAGIEAGRPLRRPEPAGLLEALKGVELRVLHSNLFAWMSWLCP